jgi:hypothetical protein
MVAALRWIFLGFVFVTVACAAESTGGFEPCEGDGCAVQDGGLQFDGGLGGEAGSPACGDGLCNGGETCETCSLDCHECPACALAPTCSNALGLPSHPTPRPDLFIGTSSPDAGADAGVPNALPGQNGCQNAQLRLRIAKITASSGGGTLSCIVSADDGATSEVATTTRTKKLGDKESFAFDVGTSLFWGQTDLHTTTNNLTITYNCFEIVDNTAWSSALDALGKAAQSAGGIAGPYGWAFGAAGAATQAAGAAVQANNGAKLKLNAQQTIDKGELLDLTNGRVWSIRQKGGGWFDGWNWEIDVESWGCAHGRPPTR